ncbi:hypothetical protein ACFFRR_001580 [Megaselia abdita]
MVLEKTYFDPVEKIWSGPVVPSLFHPDASIGMVLEFVMNRRKDKPSQIFESTGDIWTYYKFHKTAIKIARTFLEKKITQDDIIGICASNTPFVPAVAVAAFLIGTPISTLDPSFDKEGIHHIFGITQPSILFCDRAIVEKVQSAFTEINLECDIYVVDETDGEGTIEEFLLEREDDDSFKALPLKYGGDQTAAILCSSGSTGLPKGVTISHHALINCGFFSVEANDRLLSFSTLYWLSGLITLYLGIFHGGCRILINKPFSSDLLIDTIEKLKVSFIIGPPSQMALLVQNDRAVKADLSSLKNYFVGGSAVPFQVIEKLRKIIPNCYIRVGYGMTEICGTCCSGPPSGPNANGFVKQNNKVKIVDDNGNKLGIGETGEILIQTISKWNGYYKNQKATDEALDNGWVKSGDLGYFDKEGNFFVVDRKKEILKFKNFHYFPTEIELVILDLPDVIEVCVCGLPDLVMTDLPAALVVKRPESNLKEKDIIDYVSEKMADFKHLRGGVYFVDNIPKTASGKNVRKKVKELVIQLSGIKV